MGNIFAREIDVEKQECIEVDNVCFESLPCMHYVTYGGETKLTPGPSIKDLLTKHNRTVPSHFKNY